MKNSACIIGNGNFKYSSAMWKKVDETIYQLIEKGVTRFLFGEYSELGNLCFFTVGIYKRTHPEIKRIKFNVDYNEKDNTLRRSTEKYDKSIALKLMGNSEKSVNLRRYMALITESENCIFFFDDKPNSDTKAAYNYAVQNRKNIILYNPQHFKVILPFFVTNESPASHFCETGLFKAYIEIKRLPW